ncbi:hypothetical protein [Chryseobacterium sp. MP_3.2]|uniref:hypothetical protein n=1 Tax=Chryseobacterium sp. MP_3.2 TaxID=3071712 RepID=UPI002E0628A5|nr:hypothetical protein [Chryseobacterium sp. MP_3.2]
MTNTEIPLLKEELMKQFGYISYQLVLANLDVVAVRLKSSYEIVVIAYRGGNKVGYFYEEGNLSAQRVFDIFQDMPKDKNDLEAYEKSLETKIELLQMPKNNYVFVNDIEVKPYKTTT